VLHDFLVIFGALFSVLLFGALVGGFVTAMLRGPGVDAAEIYYYDEPTVVLPPVEPVVAHRSMSAMSVAEHLETATVRMWIGRPDRGVEPWLLRSEPELDSRMRIAGYVLRKMDIWATKELAVISEEDWSARTEELTQVYQGGEQ